MIRIPVKSDIYLDPNYPQITQYYIVKADYLDVLAFYYAKSSCYQITGGISCIGSAIPFGEYTIYFNNHTNDYGRIVDVTKFSVYITWSVC